MFLDVRDQDYLDNQEKIKNNIDKNTHKSYIKENYIIHIHNIEYTNNNFYNESIRIHGDDFLKSIIDMDYSWYEKKFFTKKEVPIIHEYNDNVICIYLKNHSDIKDIEEQIKNKTIKEIKLI